MVYLIILFLVTGLDQLTKYAVVSSIAFSERIAVIPGMLNLTFVTNRGAAFSLLAGVDSPWRHYFFVSVSCIAIVMLTWLWLKTHRQAPYQAAGFALIAAGALGNLIDRIRFGAVIDFIDVYWKNYHWPAFNVADAAICVGAGIFLISSIFAKDGKTER